MVVSVARGRSHAKVAKGFLLPSSNFMSTTISVEASLFHAIRDQAIKEDRSFSNMISILARSALKVRNVPE